MPGAWLDVHRMRCGLAEVPAMRDDPTDLEKAIRRLAERQALRRALERTSEEHDVREGERAVSLGTVLPLGDWDRFLVPGPDEVH